jgi:nonsense-mediated mRNA decay protein 3
VTAKQFEFEFNYRDWHNVAVTLRATLNVGELTLKDTYYIDARIKTRSCTQCSRMAGDYYEAILQVRAEERKLNADELDTIRAMVYSKVTRETTTAFLSKEVILDKGIDFYISSSFVGRQLAKQIADKFYGKYVESAKLVGKRAGKNLYRISFCVRIPDYKVGDFVVINDMLLRINRLDATNIHVYNLSEYKPETIARAQLRTTKLKILGGSELIQKAQLISVRGNEVQVLDPDDYSTVELIKPDGLSIGEPTATINVIKYDGNLYIIP